jgi:hypothetical protein
MLGCARFLRSRVWLFGASSACRRSPARYFFFAIDPSGEVIRSLEQSLAAVPGVRQVTLDWDAHPIGLTIEAGSALPAPLRAVVHAHGWCAGLLERA